jgi:hypothetical protein
MTACRYAPAFVGRTLFLEGGGTLTIGGEHEDAPGGVALSARGFDNSGFACVWVSVPEARAFALELLRHLDAKSPHGQRLAPAPGASNVPVPWAGQGRDFAAPRADGSAFDPHPLDALLPRELGPLDCRRDGCGCTFEAHEEGRCASVKGGLRCMCLGFVGIAPEGRGHVPVCAR